MSRLLSDGSAFERGLRLRNPFSSGGVRKEGASPPSSSTGLGDLLPVAVSGVQDLLRRGLLHRHRDLLAALAQHLSPGVVTEAGARGDEPAHDEDRKSTRLNSSHVESSYAVF